MRRLLLPFRFVRAVFNYWRYGMTSRQATMTYMLTTLGNISIMWSAINLVLNTFIEWNQDRLRTELPRGLPRSFAAKLDHLKKVEKDEFWSDEQSAEMRDIRLELARLNGTRKELFHGLVRMTGLNENFVVHIAKEEGNELIRRTVESDYARLMQFRNELSAMIARLTELYNPMMGLDES